MEKTQFIDFSKSEFDNLPKIELHDLYFNPSWSNVIAESKLKICIEPLTFPIDFKVNCDIGTCSKPSTVLYSQNFHNNSSHQFRFDCKQKKSTHTWTSQTIGVLH